MEHLPDIVDLLVIGGGINGAGIACDAAGRGLSVVLCEQDDLASATSSASSKLIHGGLRYLEHYQFGLVRESLGERGVMLDKAPHLIHPMTFVLPHHPTMRPAWMLQAGLFLYDHLAKYDPRLPRSRKLNLGRDPEGRALNDTVDAGFSYSDCWVDDSRLVVLNARSAVEHGAHVLTRTRVDHAERANGRWQVSLHDVMTSQERTVEACAIVNAAGPWTLGMLKSCSGNAKGKGQRLVKGSHIVVDKLYDGDHAYILQNDDGRIVFVIPFHQDFNLIGTTEVVLDAPPAPGTQLAISDEETNYLCQSVNGYLTSHLSPDDVVWSFAGIRPLFDDASDNASAVTREYVLDLDEQDGVPLLSVFGGKLTTYRQLAEKALHRLRPYFSEMGAAWTRSAPLPGGDVSDNFADQLCHMHPGIDDNILRGLARRYGTLAHVVLDGAETQTDMGQQFGAGLTAREVDYMIAHEWARTVDDVLWRRTKHGLRLSADQRDELTVYMTARV